MTTKAEAGERARLQIATLQEKINTSNRWTKESNTNQRQIAQLRAFIKAIDKARTVEMNGTTYGSLVTPHGNDTHISVDFSGHCGCGAGGQMYVGILTDGPITCEACKATFPTPVSQLGSAAPKPKAPKRTRAEIQRTAHINRLRQQIKQYQGDLKRGYGDPDQLRKDIARCEAKIARLEEVSK